MSYNTNMNIEKILENVPDSVLETVADKAGVDKNLAEMVVSTLAGEMKNGGDWLDMARDFLDKDNDGQIIDDLGDIAGSFLGKK